MPDILAVRLNWDRTALDQRLASRFYNLPVSPEPDYPFGRKGHALASAWRQLSEPAQAIKEILLELVASLPGNLLSVEERSQG